MSHLVIDLLTAINSFSNLCQLFLQLLLEHLFILRLFILNRICSCYLVWDTRAPILVLWYLIIYLLTSLDVFSNFCQLWLLLLPQCSLILPLYIFDGIWSYYLVWGSGAWILVLWHLIIYLLTIINLFCNPY